MKKISVVSICYNEEGNIREFYNQVITALQKLGDYYSYEIIIADNASTDNTIAILQDIAAGDPNFKVILNSRNFGVIRSGYNAFMHATGDAIVLMVSDLQDPPAMIEAFVRKWEEGHKVVIGVKTHSQESGLFYLLRSIYYKTLRSLSDVDLIEHFTGFGLYDKQVIEILRKIDDPYPYFRGLIAEIGFPVYRIEFSQPRRKRGISKSNFYNLYDLAMLGLTNHSKIPLRLAAFIGMLSGVISFLVGLVYLIYKLIFWQSFTLGIAPVVVGLFFFGSVQLLFLGILGEYIGAIYTQVQKRPLVIEKERINF